MNIHFEPITNENRNAALKLRIKDNQQGYVETVEQCLAEAAQRRAWRPVGIYDGTQLIGFAMYGFFRWEYFPFGKLWLDRLLIDRSCQGKGYGTIALKGLIERLSKEYHARHLYLSVVEDNRTAISLYEKFGFSFNGRRDIHGEHVMVYKF